MKVIINDGGRAAAGYKGKTGDCVARAISIAAQRPYAEVYDTLAHIQATMPKTKRRKKAGVRSASHGVYVKSKLFRDYMAKLGFTWTPTMQIGSGCKVHLTDGELPNGKLVVALSRHYTAVIDGVIHDTYDPQRSDSWSFEPDHGQALKPGQGRNVNGVYTKIGGRCVYGFWTIE
jgi:hypothetical protein